MANEPSGQPVNSPARPPRATRGWEAFEVALFVLVALPAVLLAFAVVDSDQLRFSTVATSSIVSQLVLLALVVILVWRRGEGLRALGWSGRGLGREAAIGAGLFIPLYLGAVLLETVLRRLGLPGLTEIPGYLVPHRAGEYALALVFLVVVAVVEETVFRGYLILRLHRVTGSAAVAVVLSTCVFALGHGYQGVVGVVTVGALGLVFAVVYLWRGSLVAPAVMHFLQDFVGIIILPLLLD